MATTRAAATGDPPTMIVVPDPATLVPPPAPPPDVAIAQPPATIPPTAPPDVQLDEEDRAAGATATGETVAVPRDAFKKIKDRAADRGRREAEATLQKRAAALGFTTVDEMFAAFERTPPMATTGTPPTLITLPPAGAAPSLAPGAPVAPPPAPPPVVAVPAVPPVAPGTRPDDPENDRRVPENVRKKLRAAREEMGTKTAQAVAAQKAAEAKATDYQHQLEVFREEQKMREDMIRAGVRELDYTFFELKKHLGTLDEAKLQAFDLKAWVDETRKSRPYLFGEQPVPANTGVNQPPPAPPPGPGQVTTTTGDGGKVDARTLSPEDFRKRMKSHGLNVR